MRLLVVVAAFCIATSAHADSYFQFDLTIGPYSVGLSVLKQFDRPPMYRARFDLLAGGGPHKETVEVFKLDVTIYPDGAPLLDSFAKASAAAGDRMLALQYYRRALELEPGNDAVARHVKRLAASL